MKRAILVVALLVAVGAPVAASPVPPPYYFYMSHGPKVVGTTATISLVNAESPTITMGETWTIDYLDGDGSAFYQWPEDQREIPRGETRSWTWDMRINQCYGECVNVREGDPAPAGRYEVTTTVNDVEEKFRFTLGQFFTLGFESRPGAEFKVFVATQPEVAQMTAEAAAEDKTLITSGIVRKGRPSFNPDWNFSMGPRSIVLGEVFIEVCDGSPYYVQRHRDEWLGERWCPWSSYVKRVGQ